MSPLRGLNPCTLFDFYHNVAPMGLNTAAVFKFQGEIQYNKYRNNYKAP